MIKFSACTFVICLLCSSLSLAQRTDRYLQVRKYPKDVGAQQLIRGLDRSVADTNNIEKILKIVSLYWYNEKENYLDTCLLFARQAETLSEKINYVRGRNEAIFLMCKFLIKKGDLVSANALLKKTYGEERVRLLLVLSEHYVFSAGDDIHDLEIAYPIMKHASELSDSVHSVPWKLQCLLLFGKFYFEKGDFEKGKKSFLQMIKICQERHDLSGEAHYWSELEIYMPETDSTRSYEIYCIRKAFDLFNRIHNYAEATYTLRDIVYIYLDFNKIDSAQIILEQVVGRLNSLKIKPKFETYLLASNINYLNGRFNKSLFFVLKAIEAAQNEHERMMGYKLLAFIYSALDSPKALPYYKQAFEFFAVNDHTEMYIIAYHQVLDQIRFGKVAEALLFMQVFNETHPPSTPDKKELVSASFGNIYNALHDFRKAEQFYLEMIADEEIVEKTSKATVLIPDKLSESEPYYNIGKFYTERKRFAEARPYLIKSLNALFQPPVKRKSDAEFLLFRVDSALGNYQSAIRHYERHKAINDSIFNISRSRQIEEIQAKYETLQKDQSIKLLESNHKIDRTELRTIALQRNLTLGGVSALLIISGLIYNRYRIKQRSNKLLQTQQKEISVQYAALKNLVSEKNELLVEKDDLLTEKDLLLREVNHRVKNNLQMIMSLLESQSAYLHDKVAQSAITESQNRVQALALIHQKLYQASNVTDVNMEEYISELLTYLNNSYNTNEKAIFIEHSVEAINMDVSLAIPLGLIINEAVTNAIKHAFKDRTKGKIFLSLNFVAKQRLKLSVTDNGVGLSPGVVEKKSVSLGMTLMKGLTRQLGGTFKNENKGGLAVVVEFPANTIHQARGT